MLPRLVLACALLVPNVFSLGGCVGEAAVAYKGTVVESSSPGHAFEDTENPEGLPPVSRVRVSLCDAPRCRAVSDAEGAWGPIQSVFGGSAFSDVTLRIRFEADGFEPFEYATVYEETNDPRNAEKFLVVKMRRLAR